LSAHEIGEEKMTRDTPDQELQDSNECIDALTEWFKSQGLNATDALNVMIRYSAIMMAHRAINREEMETVLAGFIKLFPEDVRDLFAEMIERGEKEETS
jgi:hypothetical protein